MEVIEKRKKQLLASTDQANLLQTKPTNKLNLSEVEEQSTYNLIQFNWLKESLISFLRLNMMWKNYQKKSTIVI
jgi:hypothetical protein